MSEQKKTRFFLDVIEENLVDDNVIINLRISKEGDKMSVVVIPEYKKKPDFINGLPPLSLYGDPKDICLNFFSELKEALNTIVKNSATIENYAVELEKLNKLAEEKIAETKDSLTAKKTTTIAKPVTKEKE
jgi:PRTRC genetic system protein E